MLCVQGVRKKTELTNSLPSRKIIYALHYIIVNIYGIHERINLSSVFLRIYGHPVY